MMTHASDGKQIRGEACDVHVDVDVAAATADDIAAVISNISQELSGGASDCLLMQPNRVEALRLAAGAATLVGVGVGVGWCAPPGGCLQ